MLVSRMLMNRAISPPNSAAPPPKPAALVASAGADAAGRVLVVDDTPIGRDLLAEVLRKEHAVETACDGVEALEKAARFRPDVILLDLVMPRMGGLEVCRRLRLDEQTRLLPILIITGTTDRERRLECIDAGANDFLNKPFDIAEVTVRTRSLIRQKRLTDQLETAETVLVAMVRMLEAKDVYTHGHSQRVADYTASLAAAVGLPSTDQERLRKAGLLHDIGKVVLREGILNKPDRLTREEFELVKLHPVEGERLLAGLRFAEPYLPAVRHHHEAFNGSGYPDGLAGEAIPLDARLMAVADSYDAMTSDRAYRRGMSADQALALLETGAGRQWDPALVRTFVGLRGHSA
jgi:putative two-component system response regulator